MSRSSQSGRGEQAAAGLLRLAETAGDPIFDALPEEQRRQLAEQLALMLRWNARINLTAIRDPETALRRHLLESLEALPLLRQELSGPEACLVDLGSGNGYPALPLLLATPARGVLVESVARKVDFLNSSIGRLGMRERVRVLEERVKKPADLPEAATVLTMRGFPEPLAWIPLLREARPRATVAAWLSTEDAQRARADLPAGRVHSLRHHAQGALFVCR